MEKNGEYLGFKTRRKNDDCDREGAERIIHTQGEHEKNDHTNATFKVNHKTN